MKECVLKKPRDLRTEAMVINFQSSHNSQEEAYDQENGK